MSYKGYLNLFLYVTVGYILLALLGMLFSPKGEYFPFFTWSLYKSAPQEIKRYYVDIVPQNSDSSHISIFNSPQNELDVKQTRAVLLRLGYCFNKPCFLESLKQIQALIPVNSCAVFYSLDEANEEEIIGYINYVQFQENPCY